MCSLEKSEDRFVGSGKGANGDHGVGMGFVGHGDLRALATRLSATSVSRRAVRRACCSENRELLMQVAAYVREQSVLGKCERLTR